MSPRNTIQKAEFGSKDCYVEPRLPHNFLICKFSMWDRLSKSGTTSKSQLREFFDVRINQMKNTIVFLLVVGLFFGLATVVHAKPQTNTVTITAGRGSGFSKAYIYEAAQSCGVIINSIDASGGLLTKTFYVVYTGEYKNAVCFYNWTIRLNRR
jgi:hypothetical protein